MTRGVVLESFGCDEAVDVALEHRIGIDDDNSGGLFQLERKSKARQTAYTP